ncbi:MAG TPA: hypothetical protein VEG61_04420, partial [Candidatus Dormibacteraeota bacterium]|nr:hypothetical protein [Candidatus Dormibacteraeota bacterium]
AFTFPALWSEYPDAKLRLIVNLLGTSFRHYLKVRRSRRRLALSSEAQIQGENTDVYVNGRCRSISGVGPASYARLASDYVIERRITPPVLIVAGGKTHCGSRFDR